MMIASIQKSTIDRLKEPHDSQSGKLNFYNYLTFEKDCDYGFLERRIENLQSTDLCQVKEFAAEIIVEEAQRRLAILVNGNAKENQKWTYKDRN